MQRSRTRWDDTIAKATGTPPYFAPEMLLGQPFHGRPADVWASGVTLAYMVSGTMPFWGESVPDIWQHVRSDEPRLGEHLSPVLRELLLAMLHKEPEKRPTVEALRQHEWVTDDGTSPMAEQAILALETEISEEELAAAVKKAYLGLLIYKFARKWKALPSRNRALRDAANVAVKAEITQRL